MKKNFYLQHPLMAMHDPRMKNLVENENLKGSGAYWFIIEKLALLPEPCADLSYLKPFCIGKITLSYLKKIITEYQLFKLYDDGFFMPLELNPTQKKDENRAKTGQKIGKMNQKTAENALKSKQKSTKKQAEESGNELTLSDLQSKTESLSDQNAINNRDKTTTSSSSEQEDQNNDTSHPKGNGSELLPIAPWQELVNSMSQDSSYIELAYMHCGYGALLQRHFKDALEYFKRHIQRYHTQEGLQCTQDVYQYFSNFTSPGSRTGAELRAYLIKLEQEEATKASNPYRYEQRIDNQRTYSGCPIPSDAPPRPDNRSIWNNVEHRWVTILAQASCSQPQGLL